MYDFNLLILYVNLLICFHKLGYTAIPRPILNIQGRPGDWL
jgi:hypothetical protein